MLEVMLYGLYVVLTLYISWKLHIACKRFIPTSPTTSRVSKELPSVSVCIPARNETHAMTQCLESVVASTYPKLEIIVLDDESNDNTSLLIKSFAHAGVRFIKGSPLSEGWLGKNHALEELLREASGTYVLYMDVDTHMKPDTIQQLVEYAHTEQASMVSVLPLRYDTWRFSVLFSTMRYFWTLLLHKPSLPATAGSAWLIDRRLLKEFYKGFSRLKQVVQPEEYVAARLMARDRYRFIISSTALGFSYEKKWSSQLETSIRLLLPMFGGNGLGVCVGVAMLLLLLSPTVLLGSALWLEWSLIHTIALWQQAVFVALYGLYLSRVWASNWWLGALLLPFVLAQELLLLIISSVRYARHTVTWKGRSVSIDARTASRYTK